MRKTILIVDDNDMLRVAVGLLLAGNLGDVELVEAANSAEAIEKAIAIPPDLVILDLAMPGMNGLFAAGSIKNLAPKAPILLFSLFADDVSDPYRFGVDAVVSKAKGHDTFLNAVRELLALPCTPKPPAASAAPL